MNNTVKTKLLILVLTCGVSGLAQADPPTLIRMVRNITRASLRDSSVRQYVDSKAPVTMIGMASVSGLPETWLMELHDSFGSSCRRVCQLAFQRLLESGIQLRELIHGPQVHS